VGDVVDELPPDNLITGHNKNQRRRARHALILCTGCPEMAANFEKIMIVVSAATKRSK
jgi:hypothetical protein